MTPLAEVIVNAAADLEPHAAEFDAVVCAGDRHGMVLGGIIASMFDVPLMLVCRNPVSWTVSDITTFGNCKPRGMRYLYVDDWFTFGRSLADVFAYLDSCGEPAPVVATYEVNTRAYAPR